MSDSPSRRAADKAAEQPTSKRDRRRADPVWRERSGRRRSAIGLTVVLALFGAGLLWSLVPTDVEPPPEPVRTSLPIPEGAGPWPDLVQPLAITDDGGRIVFHSLERRSNGEEGGLWTRTLPDGPAVRIPGTERAGSHLLSPDGAWIVFHDVEDGTLRRVPVGGGEPDVLVHTEATGASGFLGGAWGEGGSIVYALRTGLRRLFVETGVDEALTATDPRDEIRHIQPHPLPDGSGVVYTVARTSSPESDIAVLKFSGESAVLRPGHSAHPASPGLLVFGQDDSTLWAAEVTPEWDALVGEPIPVQEGVLGASMPYPRKTFVLGGDGTLAFLPTVAPAYSELLWVDRSGGVEQILDTRDLQLPPGGTIGVARLSPDGEKVALRIRNHADQPQYKLFVLDLPTRVLSPINVQANADWPVWTPDGESIVFNRFSKSPDESPTHDLYEVRANAAAPPEPLTSSNPALQHAQTFTDDGRWLVVQQRDAVGEEADLWMLPVGHAAEPRPLVRSDTSEVQAALSPDGRWLAYASRESGDVVVTDFPEAHEHTVVSAEPGRSPVWSPRGDELFYRRSSDGAVMAVPIGSRSMLRAGPPELLFEGGFITGSSYGRSFDVAPDGERFLMIGDDGRRDHAPRIEVVRGWLHDVQRRFGG